MNFRQLQCICEIARCGNQTISAAAAALHTSQPNLSKQLKVLEEELGVAIFVRDRNRVAGMTAEGERILAHAQAILKEADSIRTIARDRTLDNAGALGIAVTHTQAQYVLPEIVKAFGTRYPKVHVTLRQADPLRIADLLASGEVELGVTTNEPPLAAGLVVLPIRQFNRVVIVPRAHPLARSRHLTLRRLAQYPLVTYEPAFASRDAVVNTFYAAGLEPNVVMSGNDADVIKSCVEQGLGYAVLSSVAFRPDRDVTLKALPADHLFPPSITRLWLSRCNYARRYTYDFIELCSAGFTRAAVQALQAQAA